MDSEKENYVFRAISVLYAEMEKRNIANDFALSGIKAASDYLLGCISKEELRDKHIDLYQYACSFEAKDHLPYGVSIALSVTELNALTAMRATVRETLWLQDSNRGCPVKPTGA